MRGYFSYIWKGKTGRRRTLFACGFLTKKEKEIKMKFVKPEFGAYVVFKDEDAAAKMEWLFGMLLRRKMCCFGSYFNAYKLW